MACEDATDRAAPATARHTPFAPSTVSPAAHNEVSGITITRR